MITQSQRFGKVTVEQYKPSLADNKVVVEIGWVGSAVPTDVFGAERFYQDLGAAIEFSNMETKRLKLSGYVVVQRSHDRAF